MNHSELQAKATRLERELQETHNLLTSTIDPEVVTADLARTRAYAFDSAKMSVEDVVAGCAD